MKRGFVIVNILRIFRGMPAPVIEKENAKRENFLQTIDKLTSSLNQLG